MANPVLIELTASIVAAQVQNNRIAVSELPGMISDVYGALSGLGEPVAEVEAKPVPAVSIRSSVKPDFIACLDCGKRQRTLKKHLSIAHGLAPDAYRAKWSLAADYPMVAPNYSTQRSDMAKARGFGRKPGEKA